MHGELTFPDDLETEFFYRPDPGFIGQDEFRYRPFTYHKPLHEKYGALKKVDSDQEFIVTITVNQLPRAVQTRTVRQDLGVERKINLLFVIDNSKSMAGEQRVLASSFDRFIEGFLEQRLDFRIGVLTTDAVNVFKEPKKRSPAVYGAGYLQLTGDALERKRRIEANRQSGKPTDGIEYQPFLDNRTPDLAARFEELVQVGTTGNRYETAIVPVLMSYVTDLSPGAIEHNTASFGEEPFFYQENAFLSIVVVSDEDEATSWITRVNSEDGSIGEYKVKIGTDYLMKTRNGEQATEQVIAAFLKSLKRLKREASFRIDAVINPKRKSAFSRLAELGGGQKVDIRKDFSAALIAIGDSIAKQASRTFRVPEPGLDEVIFPRFDPGDDQWGTDSRGLSERVVLRSRSPDGRTPREGWRGQFRCGRPDRLRRGVSALSRNYAVDQVDLKQPVESIELASPARNTFGYSSEFLSSLHLNILPHLSTSDCIVPAERRGEKTGVGRFLDGDPGTWNRIADSSGLIRLRP